MANPNEDFQAVRDLQPKKKFLWLNPKQQNNVLIAFVCLFLSFSAWLIQRLNQEFSYKVEFPIQIEYDSTTVIPLKPLPKTIMVPITAMGWDLLKYYFGYTTEKLTISPQRLPKSNYVSPNRLKTQLQELLPHLKREELEIDTLWFFFDSLATKEVVVKPIFKESQFEEFIELRSHPYVEPSTITLKGAKSNLAKHSGSIQIGYKGKEKINKNCNLEFTLPDSILSLTDFRGKITVRLETQKYRIVEQKVKLQFVHFPDDMAKKWRDSVVKLRYKATPGSEVFTKGDEKIVLDYLKLDSNKCINLEVPEKWKTEREVVLTPSKMCLAN